MHHTTTAAIRPMSIWWSLTLTLCLSLSCASGALAAGPKPIVLDPEYRHDRFGTTPRDIVKEFRAYTTSFDSLDDNNGDGENDAWGIPEWVASEIKRFEGDCIPTKSRPSWFSDSDLVTQGIAPKDKSYRYSQQWRGLHPGWYVRGHMAMKFITERQGHDAAYNTHTMLNAVPQRSTFNSGIWQELEYLTGAWAQEYGSVWVITGPVIIDDQPSGWIGQGDEFRVAIPDALFKIVIKDSESDPARPDVLAFLYPQVGPTYHDKIPHPHQDYLVSVDYLEELTGLDFFTVLPDAIEDEVESETKEWLWAMDDDNFLRACR